MKEKPVLPLVLKMALPMVISMLVNSLYNIIDSFFVAQVSEDAMTAISIVYPLQNLANAVGVGFGVGINAAVAYYPGAGNGKAANRSATLGIILSALHGIVLAGICVLLIRPFISMFTDSEEITAYGLDYFYTVIAFAPVLTLGMAFEKVLQATGKMKTTMFCMAIGAVANIILDPIFISGLGAVPAMGVFGAALATGIGQALSLISQLYCRIPACKNTRAPAVGAPRRRKDLPQTLLCGYPRLLKFGAALLYDNGAQRHTCGICRSLCSDIGCLLQIADVYLFHHKRHCARYTPVN